MNWADLKATANAAYEKMTTKKGAFDIMQKKRTGKERGGLKGMLDD